MSFRPNDARPSGPKRAVFLNTPDFLVRTLKREDASDGWAPWFADPFLRRMVNSDQTAWNAETARRYIRQFDQRKDLLLGVFAKPEPRLIGIMTVHIDYASSRALITGMVGDAAYREKGAMQQVAPSFHDYLFDKVGVDAILGYVLAHNDVMLNALLKRGWIVDKTLEKHNKSNEDGTMLDVLMVSLGRDAWQRQKQAAGGATR